MPSPNFLTLEVVERVLAKIPTLTIGVLGDLFLDRYLDLDATLTEPSIETGLDAYQVVAVRSYPGAAGTVINNLAALGVGRIVPIAVIGDDGEGYELRQALARLPAVDPEGILSWPGRRTPTYTKPMLRETGQSARELNRLDIHNRALLPREAEERVIARMRESWPTLDGLVVLDQVSQSDCGVVTAGVRERLTSLARENVHRPVLADSRERIKLFQGVSLKPNQSEVLRDSQTSILETAVSSMGQSCADGGAVYCTRGEQGILLFCNRSFTEVPGYPVAGPIDPVGAGDSTSAGIICALASGASPQVAAAFGNLVASITVQQLGTTGTATPAQVRERFREVASG